MKTDKGFELIYWRLSYRRKFIRTLWMAPLIILVTVLIWFAFHSKVITAAYFILTAAIEFIQAIYTYKKWKGSCDFKEYQ